MVGAYVLTQRDVLVHRVKRDVIAIGSYRLDSHQVSRWVGPDGWLYQEGWFAHPRSTYEIPYRAITPKRSEIRDLLVPVAVSATHVAWASLRTEPQEMLMGEAAGDAALLALRGTPSRPAGPIPVQDVSARRLQVELLAHGGILALPPAASVTRPLPLPARPEPPRRPAIRAR
jgi:FAD-dependent oxidoreductase family protein